MNESRTQSNRQLLTDLVQYSHNVASCEVGCIEKVTTVLAREFTLVGDDWKTSLKQALKLALIELGNDLLQIYDATAEFLLNRIRSRLQEELQLVPLIKRKRFRRKLWKPANVIRRIEQQAARTFKQELQKGSKPRDIESAIEDAITSDRNWSAYVRTNVQMANNEALKDTYEANQDLIAGEQFIATLDTRTCPICSALDGKVYWYKGPKGQPKKKDIQRPPLHPRCRCIMSPIVKSADELEDEGIYVKNKDFVDGQPAERVSYQQWLDSVDSDTQENALGFYRYHLYKKGIPINKFVHNGVPLEPIDLAKLEPGKVVGTKDFDLDVEEIEPKRRIQITTKSRPTRNMIRSHKKLESVKGRRGVANRGAKAEQIALSGTQQEIDKQVMDLVNQNPMLDVRVSEDSELLWPEVYVKVYRHKGQYHEHISEKPIRGARRVKINPNTKKFYRPRQRKLHQWERENLPKIEGYRAVAAKGFRIKYVNDKGYTRWEYF